MRAFYDTYWRSMVFSGILECVGQCYEIIKPLVYTMAIDVIAEDRSEGISTWILFVIFANLFTNVTDCWWWKMRDHKVTLLAHRARYGLKHVLYRKMLNMQAGSCQNELTEGTMLHIMDMTGHMWCGVFIWPLCFFKFFQLNIIAGFYLYMNIGAIYLVIVIIVVGVFLATCRLNDLLKG